MEKNHKENKILTVDGLMERGFEAAAFGKNTIVLRNREKGYEAIALTSGEVIDIYKMKENETKKPAINNAFENQLRKYNHLEGMTVDTLKKRGFEGMGLTEPINEYAIFHKHENGVHYVAEVRRGWVEKIDAAKE
jgi:hypothetical protein